MLRKHAIVSKGRNASKISAPMHVPDPGGGREKEQATATGEDKLQRLRTPETGQGQGGTRHAHQ